MPDDSSRIGQNLDKHLTVADLSQRLREQLISFDAAEASRHEALTRDLMDDLGPLPVMERLGEQLGISDLLEAAGKAATDLFRGATAAFAGLAQSALEALDDASAPNWSELTIPQAFDVMELMEETGWGLSWCPPAAVLLELLEAPDLETRHRVLLANEGIIIVDLRGLIREVMRPELAELRNGAEQSLEAYAGGLCWPSQALSTNLLSTVIHEVLAHRRFKDAADAFEALDVEEADLRELRLVAILSAVARVLSRYFPGDPVPEDFNRHASTHFVGTPQYGQLNALTSLMLVVSLLREIQSVFDLMDRLSAVEVKAAAVAG